LPRFWPNQFYKIILGIVLIGLCLPSLSQTEPLSLPKTINYPGIIETFEKIIEIDRDKNQKKMNMIVQKGGFLPLSIPASDLDLDPDFLNSILLHSDSGYLRLASTNKCRFYEAILTDLLKNGEGKIKNIVMNYFAKGIRQSGFISKKDFLKKIIPEDCPETQKNIQVFQVKTIKETIKGLDLKTPRGVDECKSKHSSWIKTSETPFLCQIHEYLKDPSRGEVISKILEQKISKMEKKYIKSLCENLNNEDLFCDEMMSSSFWDQGIEINQNQIFSDEICRKVMNSRELTSLQREVCLDRLKKEPDLCLYTSKESSGLRPQPDCDQLSNALNFSSLKNTLNDCPGKSDQMVVTNMGRILSHFNFKNVLMPQYPCHSSSSFLFYEFNKQFDNDENWGVEACYTDQITGKEICYKTFFSDITGGTDSYAGVVGNILKKTRGLDQSTVCEVINNTDYNPLVLRFKSGCFIIVESNFCHITSCKHKIILNDRLIDFIKIKSKSTIDYFPTDLGHERFSQTYMLNKDFKKSSKKINELADIKKFFKKTNLGLIHGIGCAEDLLPTFFRGYSLNQCSALPFIINGIIKNNEGDKVVLVTRTAVDNLEAPRLISWSSVFSSVRSYQKKHPLKLWTMYALD